VTSRIAEICKALQGSSHLFILLDYDGTLVPIASTPSHARPTDRLLKVLDSLAAMERLQIGVISGRTMEDLKSLLPVPGIFRVACHGAFILTPAGASYSLLPEGWSPSPLSEITRKVEEAIPADGGFLLEDKGVSLALHYRNADPHEARRLLEQVAVWASEGVSRGQISILRGHMVLEIKPPGIDKGKAALFLLERFSPSGSLPIYVGDDETDEDAFRILRGRGLTVRVGTGAQPTRATFQLADSSQVIELLERIQENYGTTL